MPKTYSYYFDSIMCYATLREFDEVEDPREVLEGIVFCSERTR